MENNTIDSIMLHLLNGIFDADIFEDLCFNYDLSTVEEDTDWIAWVVLEDGTGKTYTYAHQPYTGWAVVPYPTD